MAADLALHDDLVTTAIAAAGGRVFKHTGDGVLATFADAAASAVAAAEIQRSMELQPWRVPDGIRVRVVLHSGSAHERDGDLFGPSVNRLARLLLRCPEGAVLVSEATAVLLADGMPAGLSVRELGRVELRDVGRSEAVYCIVGEHLAAVEAHAIVGLAGPRVGSLPAIDDDLVGRTREIAAVLDAIRTHPVVSIVGVGGMGKTRLALEAATAADFLDGAWWCDLASATTPAAVPAAVLAALGARQVSGRSAVDSIVDHLAAQCALVVFDNCEHVVDAARALVSAIRAHCDNVRILATSREALGLRGEHVVSLSSLPASDAVGLFCTRAASARPDLSLDRATLATIDEVCSRLDGIPLAIELAAARCRSMAPVEIAARLGDRFRLLRGGRVGVERHRTLQAAVEWSYCLLDADERALFDRMAVFAGGALIDAIAAVGDLDEYDALDILDRLVARSMIVAADTPLGTRYRQLETLRQYAEDRLVEHNTGEEARGRHLAWAHSVATWLHDSQLTDTEVDAFDRYIAEVDNLRAAVHYAVSADRHLEACEVIAGIGPYGLYRPTFEIIDWFDPTRIDADAWTDAVASTAGIRAALAYFAGNTAQTTDILATVPARFAHNGFVLSASTYESLWVTANFDLAETRLAAVVPATDQEAFLLRVNQGQVFQTRMWDRAADPDYAHAALVHTERIVDETRSRDAQVSLAVALVTYGYCLDQSGDHAASIAAQSESIELAERAGAGFLVDAARGGLITGLTQIATGDPSQLRETAATIRDALAAALQRHSHALAAEYLYRCVEPVVWSAGDQRTAVLLGTFGRRHTPASALVPPAVDTTGLDAKAVAQIETEVAHLDIDRAGTIALAALEEIIDSD